MRGTMLWFNETKDLGVITTEDGERVDVHGPDFVDGERPVGRCAGVPVEFQVAENGEGHKAEAVRLVIAVDPRRARRRHGHR